MRSYYLGFLLLCMPSGISGDTPANCTYDDVVGLWTFYEGERGHSNSLDCSKPTGLNHLTKLQLVFPNRVVDEFGNEGTWTLIYNQGFEVTIRSRKYFAFSNFTQIEHHQVESRCYETLPGWSHDTYARDWACFVGKKVGEKVVKVHRDKSRLLSGKHANFYLQGRQYQNDENLITAINQRQDSWTAKAYPEWEEYNLMEVIRRFGGMKSRVHEKPAPAEVTEAVRLRANALPERFDWRNVMGRNYVSPIRNQGGCGSCYSFASMALLEARYRIMTNNSEPLVFSPQDVVECSEYSQGCDGGFAYLTAGKYAEDFGVVEEKCNPYPESEPTQQTCHTSRSCRRYYATNYHYVGGYYGACNEPLMRIALVENGPLAVGLEVYDDLAHYTNGIYHHTGLKDRKNSLNKWDPFQLTNHAVLVVGYDVNTTTGESYWIVKNSWGTDWGEDGYFRIRRGTDECGIESMAMEVTPIPTY